MARIPDSELERLKREVSLERLVERKGVQLERRGADLVGRCPFHEDDSPSLVVTPSKNLWHCLGACQAGGSVIDWVMRTEGVSFRHAVELLRADVALIAPGKVVKTGTVRRLEAPVAQDGDDRDALRQVVDYYQRTLMESPEALAYLQGRGLRDRELIETFKLGFANRTLGLRLPEKNRKAGADLRGRLQRLGILRESGHEHFNGSVVVPIFDESGAVVEMYGRKVTEGLRAGTPDHLYLPGPHRGVWNAHGLGADVVLCEALIDAMSFWVAGHKSVTAAYGVEGFTDEHLQVFQEREVRRVLIAYDRDSAGDRAAVQLALRLTAAGMDCYRVQFAKAQDANDLLVEAGSQASERLAQVLRKAVWLGMGKAGSVSVPDVTAHADEQTSESEPTPSAALTATPIPPAPAPEPVAELGEHDIVVCFGERRWRVRGLEKNASFEVMRVNAMVSLEGQDRFHVDTLDLYSARARTVFLKQASEELGIAEEAIKRDLGRLLLRLEELQQERIEAALRPRSQAETVSPDEEAEALALLKDPRLVARILQDFERAGVVGERTAKLAGYLAAVSRKLEQPLAVVVQSSSAAGKSALLEAVLAFVPEEERVKFSAMTGQSLYYMGEQDLEHKVLALVEEEGADRAAYALKLLQSEGELSIASTGKDPDTGRLVTHEYRVKGPVAIFLTTTAIDVDEELMNRCLVLAVDEGREQTRAIHAHQRRRQTLDGLFAEGERERILRLHRIAQRLLKPVLVVNPYAERLTFADERTRTRRDHLKYLTLIRTIALLHQHQRERKEAQRHGRTVSYIEVTPLDIELANELAHEVLGRSLDELPPQTRRLLLLVDEMAMSLCEREDMKRTELRFSRRQVREHTGWGDTQLRLHLGRLAELEYLLVHRGGRGQSFCYELLWDGEGRDGAPRLGGLVEAGDLATYIEDAHEYDGNLAGSEGEFAGSSRPLRAPNAGGSRGGHSNGAPVRLLDGGRKTTSGDDDRQQVIAVGGA